jgi:hypothetical protein
MAGDTGQGQTATIFAQSIPNVQSIEVNNTGEVLRETVADGVLTAALGTGWEFTINFIAPTTGNAHAGRGYQGGRIGQLSPSKAARPSTRQARAAARGFVNRRRRRGLSLTP